MLWNMERGQTTQSVGAKLTFDCLFFTVLFSNVNLSLLINCKPKCTLIWKVPLAFLFRQSMEKHDTLLLTFYHNAVNGIQPKQDTIKQSTSVLRLVRCLGRITWCSACSPCGTVTVQVFWTKWDSLNFLDGRQPKMWEGGKVRTIHLCIVSTV